MIKKVYISLYVTMTFFSTSFAQERNLKPTQNLTITEGLAHNGVTSILEDTKGYFWFGTYDGLNRYNGYEFTVYKNTVDKELLVSNRIRALAEDKKGNLSHLIYSTC